MKIIGFLFGLGKKIEEGGCYLYGIECKELSMNEMGFSPPIFMHRSECTLGLVGY